MIGEWVYPKLTSDFAVYDPKKAPRYRKNGNFLEIYGVVKPTQTIPKSFDETKIFDLPSEFLPKYDINLIMQGSGTNKWTLGITQTLGGVGISRYGTTEIIDIPTGAWLPFYALVPIT